ncbi:ankyrin repeat-containing protein [Trifolium repens]|nr:ankyrin repeat-containing protein [Trifolium repens]
MAAKATVAMRTATTVAEFIALFRPLMWSFFSFLAIFWTLMPVWRVCWSWDCTSCFISLTVCLSCFAALGGFPWSVELTAPASLTKETSSGLPNFSAMSRGVSPALLVALILIPSVDNKQRTFCSL